jgi:hypothetical protein
MFSKLEIDLLNWSAPSPRAAAAVGTFRLTDRFALTKMPRESTMPRGDKSSYTDKQKRQTEHSRKVNRGVPEGEAERRAWATVNKESHGGKKSGSERGTQEEHSPSRKGGHLGAAAAAKRSPAKRSRSAKNRPNQKAPCRLTKTDRSSETIMDLEAVCVRAPRRADLRSAQLSLSEPRGGSRGRRHHARKIPKDRKLGSIRSANACCMIQAAGPWMLPA